MNGWWWVGEVVKPTARLPLIQRRGDDTSGFILRLPRRRALVVGWSR